MASHEGFDPTVPDKCRRQPCAERSGLREAAGQPSGGVAGGLHDGAIRNLAAVQLMLARVADGLTAEERRRLQPLTLAVDQFEAGLRLAVVVPVSDSRAPGPVCRLRQSVKRLPAYAVVVCSTGGASVGAGVAATLFLAICFLDLFAAGLFFL